MAGSPVEASSALADRDTVGQVLELAGLLRQVSDSPELDLQLLLTNSLGSSRASLLARPERVLSVEQLERFSADLQRRLRGEPLAYIVGSKAFWDFELAVDSRVLIPRPETELLVERALECLAGLENRTLELLDLGTGSGAIAIALARHSRHWRITATDQSAAALELAAHNASLLGVDNIQFVKGEWFGPLVNRQFDLIVSNPPYVEAGDPHLQRDGLPFEPVEALVANGKGLDCLRQIIGLAAGHMNPGASLLLEHGYDQAAAVAALMVDAGFRQICCWQDLAGLDRVTAARFN